MNICANCKHVRKGDAIDRRKAEPGYPAPGPRIGLRGGDYICGRLPIMPARVDPQSGFQAQPSGEDCRVLNPAGECEDFAQGSYGPAAAFAIGTTALIVLTALLALST